MELPYLHDAELARDMLATGSDLELEQFVWNVVFTSPFSLEIMDMITQRTLEIGIEIKELEKCIPSFYRWMHGELDLIQFNKVFINSDDLIKDLERRERMVELGVLTLEDGFNQLKAEDV